ncbi:NAD(P)/FAD-dependent oxidoreductase [Pseudonocardia acidicola]|uniref:FAD-dependent oxidoreductase n=1 Tax=Pseudonocardia acidicola TaxID=2724939 RepID=A0ABX1SF60_9PSEU|nr:FAD-dependent oxidoreductase [Pseudonocardia acidicola]NMI00181.1 FAD-dependent oxidoreductase [Pseudonocardia acidicola]
MSAREVVAIVGAGLAGARAAETLRGQGFAGTIVMFGEEPTAPYHRPPLSKALLTEEPDLATLLVHPETWYRDNDVDLRLGCRITGVDLHDRRVKDARGDRHPFETLILTTGAVARRLDGCRDDPDSRVLVLRTLADAARLRARLATAGSVLVVGGGFIGAEAASGAVARGASVTMLEAAEGPFARSLGGVASRILADFYRNHGIDVVTSAPVAGVRASAAGVTVSAEDGRRWDADVVVAGVGAVPADDLASAAGLTTGNGVRVDARGCTDAPFVFAAGDVANRFEPALGRHIRPEHWQNAQNHAVAVACNVLGADTPFSEIPWFWSDQFSVNLQMAGLPMDADEVVLRGAPDDSRFSIFYLSGSRVVAAFGMDTARDIAVAKRLIGRGVVVDRASIADESTDLKALLSRNGGK